MQARPFNRERPVVSSARLSGPPPRPRRFVTAPGPPTLSESHPSPCQALASFGLFAINSFVAVTLFVAEEKRQVRALVGLAWCNPFSPERFELEREALGGAWSPPPSLGKGLLLGRPPANPNFSALLELSRALATKARDRLSARVPAHDAPPPSGFADYHDLILFLQFHRFEDDFHRFIGRSQQRGSAEERLAFYDRFRSELAAWFPFSHPGLVPVLSAAELFASFFQVRRAYAHTHECIIGASQAATRLRSRVWESILTHDLRRYQRALSGRMADITTLITGPSGSGKELVARAVGLSRFIPFDENTRRFTGDYLRDFYPIALAALSPTLIESELFGHRRGAFTGALQDRRGYLETCGPHGTVFLDEIGETDPAIQVKLLRVLQTRAFQPIGDTEPRHFAGKFIAATNRDLVAEIAAGRFREDFFYRLCADRIQTPALRDILADAPDELENLVGFIAARVAGPEEAPVLAQEVIAYIARHLPKGYAWPGNFRELEQCVRNILVHGEYQPATGLARLGSSAQEAGDGGPIPGPDGTPLPVESLLARHIGAAYAATGSFEETARQLQIDRRTVRKYVRLNAGGKPAPQG